MRKNEATVIKCEGRKKLLVIITLIVVVVALVIIIAFDALQQAVLLGHVARLHLHMTLAVLHVRE